MLVIVCYDVNTETREGRRRLRRVAKACEGVGQRVQKSVFECQVDLARMETLERKLLELMDLETDCLRLYRLADSRGCEVREHGPSPRTHRHYRADRQKCRYNNRNSLRPERNVAKESLKLVAERKCQGFPILGRRGTKPQHMRTLLGTRWRV